MKYHSLMVPLLVMSYLVAIGILQEVEVAYRRTFAVLSMFTIILSGLPSLAISSAGLSIFGLLQIGGMMLTDLLGVFLLITMFWSTRNRHDGKNQDATFWLYFCSVAGVVVAAPFGHLAGWGIDIGLKTFPGVSGFLEITGMKSDVLQDGLITSHSHFIVVATITGLVALATKIFGYETLKGWKRRLGFSAIWLIILTLVSVIVIYTISTLTGWESLTFFVSGPNGENGIPLDDILLSLCELGWLVLILVSITTSAAGVWEFARGKLIRAAVFLNLLAGFMGVVVLGVYIELHEIFYGGGELPARGALNDQVFIRAHIVYPFLILPILLCFILATASSTTSSQYPQKWYLTFLWLSILGTTLGLMGEYIWVFSLNRSVFLFAMIFLGAAMVAGAGALLTTALSPSSMTQKI